MIRELPAWRQNREEKIATTIDNTTVMDPDAYLHKVSRAFDNPEVISHEVGAYLPSWTFQASPFVDICCTCRPTDTAQMLRDSALTIR